MRKFYYACTKADFILRTSLFFKPDLNQGENGEMKKKLILICKIILKFEISEDNKIQANVQFLYCRGSNMEY